MDKNYQPVDQFFKEALKNHTLLPSEESKTAFLKEATALVGSNKNGKRWIIYLSSLILLTMIGLTLWMFIPKGSSAGKSNPIVESEKTMTPPQSFASTSTSPVPTAATSTQPVVHPVLTPLSGEDKTVQRSSSASSSSSSAYAAAATSPSNATPSAPSSHSSLVTPTLLPESNLAQPSLPSPTPLPVEVEQPGTTPIDTLPPSATPPSSKPENYFSSTRRFQLATGIYITPEWLNNIIGTEKYVTNFGLEETFYFGRYSIRTGAGLSITKGTNELAISYNEYLGSYKQLDSMSFGWNQSHTNLVPTYYLSDKDVWDSLMKLENTQIVKRYTYLQIPLVLGYDFWSNDDFSIGARLGPTFSVLLASKQLTDNYDPGKDKILLINEITPERIQTNWQLMAGLSFGFGNKRRVGIEFEPEVRYYFNSVYEKSGSTQKPWSFGFHIALLMKY